MAPTRRKPTKRKIKEESIGAPAGALSVDELRQNEAEFAAGSAADALNSHGFAAGVPDPRGFAADASGSRGFTPDAPNPRGSASGGFAAEGFRPTVIREETPIEGDFGGEELGDEDRTETPRKTYRLNKFHVVLIAILAVLIAIEGGFCLLRWTPDDAADMQGTWYVNESDKTIAITDEVIVLAEDVAYGYEIDEAAKTITYEFGIMEGSGRYRFSLDRTQLAIMDGEFTFWETLTSDISWTFEALLAQLFGDPLAPGKGEMVALLTRAPFESLPSDPSGEGDVPAEGTPEGEAPGEGDSQEGTPAGQEGESQEGGSQQGGSQEGNSQQGEASGEGSGSAQEGSSRNDKLTVVDKLVVSDKPMSA